MHDDDSRHDMALCRYQAISAYLALDPPRGQRRQLLEHLSAKEWRGPDGAPLRPSAETLRSWVRRYRRGGLDGLKDKPRPRRGVKVLSPEEVDLVVALKKEVPERSLDRIIRMVESKGILEAGKVRRTTLHRVLQEHGVSARPGSDSAGKDLDRFEADAPNDLWHSDGRTGPWLPDPERRGKMRQTNLFAFLDDHSRKGLDGRFSFAESLPHLELVFRRSMQKYGKPKRLYYDNGKVYRARHMRHIVATLGIHGIVFTQAYRPEGHGKIEAFNRLVKSAFIAEVKASNIRTLDELNEAFLAWMELEYNAQVHSETGQTPNERWSAGIEHVGYIDERQLRLAFRWKEDRTPDKTGLFSLFGTRYQVGPGLARRRIQVYFDPEDLSEVEVHHGGNFVERCVPFEVQTHRRPKPEPREPAAPADGASKPTLDWLGHLTEKRRRQALIAASGAQSAAPADTSRETADDAIVELLREHLDPAAFDEASARTFLRQYGPFDEEPAGRVLYEQIAQGGAYHHVLVYLEAIREALR